MAGGTRSTVAAMPPGAQRQANYDQNYGAMIVENKGRRTVTAQAIRHMRDTPHLPFTSPGGLTYQPMGGGGGGGAPAQTQQHRVHHVLYHNMDDPNRPGPHSHMTDPGAPGPGTPHPDPLGQADQIAAQAYGAPAPGGWHPGFGPPAAVGGPGGPGVMHVNQGGPNNRDRFDVTPAPPVTTGYQGGMAGGGAATGGYRMVAESPAGYVPGGVSVPTNVITFYNN